VFVVAIGAKWLDGKIVCWFVDKISLFGMIAAVAAWSRLSHRNMTWWQFQLPAGNWNASVAASLQPETSDERNGNRCFSLIVLWIVYRCTLSSSLLPQVVAPL
jgi:hypothetical protein